MSWARRIKLPLFQGLSLYDVSLFFFKGIIEGRITSRASSSAFSFFMALFPGLIFLFTLIPYFSSVEGLREEIFQFFDQVLPPDTYDSVKSTIDDIVSTKREGLLSFGFLFALIFANNGVNSLLSNLQYTAHDLEFRNFWKQLLVSGLITISLSFIFLTGMILIIFSSSVLNSLLDYFDLGEISPTLVEGTRLVLMLALVLTAIAIMYNYGAAKKRDWSFFSPGAILATFLIIVTSWGFSYYVSHLSQYNRLYGSIGTLLVILLWIYLNALVLIIGFELNASISSAKQLKAKKKIEHEKFDKHAAT